MSNKFKVFIDGKAGTTGLKIYERLGKRDDIEILLIDEDKRKDSAERAKMINSAILYFSVSRMQLLRKLLHCVLIPKQG